MKTRLVLLTGLLCLCAVVVSVSADEPSVEPKKYVPLTTGPGAPIPAGQTAITSLAVAPDGYLYGGTSAEKGLECYLFRLKGTELSSLGTLSPAIPAQQKIFHSLVVGKDGRIYGGTLNDVPGKKEKESYPGGHLFRYDPEAGNIQDLGIPVKGNGIYCLAANVEGTTIYGMTYPDAHFFKYDIDSGVTEDKGSVAPEKFYDVNDRKTRALTRALICDDDGNVYGSREEGYLFRYDPKADKIEKLDVRMPAMPGMYDDGLHLLVADSFARDGNGLIYGGTSANGYLFVFDPKKDTVLNLGKPIRESHIRALAVGADGKVYGVGGEEGSICRLFVYDPATRAMEDKGRIAGDPSWIASDFEAMAVGGDGTIYLGHAERLSNVFYFKP